MLPDRPTQADAMIDLINEVRSTFHLLRVLARDLHGGSDLTAARRGVMIDLLQGSAQTVPTLARKRPVSRQHIQGVVNGLLADDWVELLDNPAHKRSKLVSLTTSGRETITRMLSLESDLLQHLDMDPTPGEMAQAAELLRQARAALTSLRISL